MAEEAGWPRREAGERKHPDQGPELECESSICDRSPLPRHQTEAGCFWVKRAVYLWSPRDPVWVLDKVPMPSSASVLGSSEACVTIDADP